jgi:hypothetical protein
MGSIVGLVLGLGLLLIWQSVFVGQNSAPSPDLPDPHPTVRRDRCGGAGVCHRSAARGCVPRLWCRYHTGCFRGVSDVYGRSRVWSWGVVRALGAGAISRSTTAPGAS